MIPAAAGIAFLVTTPLINAGIRICTANGWVAKPRHDRWHRGLPCLFGGVPLWAGFFVVCLLLVRSGEMWKVIGLASFMFLLGFVDDILRLRPRIKFLVQLADALLLVSIGIVYPISTNIFVCAAFSILWVIAITNAFNLLDNMDGLASGVALIATVYLSAFFYLQGEQQYALALAAFAGSLAAFLRFNFKPARVFMGDTGSLAIGFFLGSSMLVRVVHLANVSAFLFIPVLLLSVPLFDTFFVSVTRRMRGQPASQGGTDHSSHRFVQFGLRERGAVLLLYGISVISGGIALLVRTMRYQDALGLVVTWFFVLFLFGVHLFQPLPETAGKAVPNLLRRVISRDVLALLLDPFALGLAYYLSYLLRFRSPGAEWKVFYESLPVVVMAKFGSLYVAGTYRRSWWRASFTDVWRIMQAILMGELLTVAVLTGLYRFAGYSRAIFVVDGIVSWAFLLGVRSSFRWFQQLLFATRASSSDRRVFVIGTSQRAETALQFLKSNGITCVGLIDSNRGADLGRHVWGVRVLGRLGDIGRLSQERGVFEVVLPQNEPLNCTASELEQVCREADIVFTTLGLHSLENSGGYAAMSRASGASASAD